MKYPIYIISKGRWKNPLTANMFLKENINFLIMVEPQEYENYKKTIPEKFIYKLPFQNLGLGSYPARNHAWEHAFKKNHKRHWCFDDNIRSAKILIKQKRIRCSAIEAIEAIENFTDRYNNIGISAFNYCSFVIPPVKKPFFINTHAYSCMLINNHIKPRWRLKYNEDVDLCLQVLTQGLNTLLFNVYSMEKVSTVAKMKGGNQEELYLGNSHDKKVLKAQSLQVLWPDYVKTIFRFNRPHHFVDWKKHFKQPLLRINN